VIIAILQMCFAVRAEISVLHGAELHWLFGGVLAPPFVALPLSSETMGISMLTYVFSKSNLWRAACCAVVLLSAAAVRGETWAERLGYDADKKVIIVHLQEMGLAYETNAAGRKLCEEGGACSSSAMAPCPWFADFAAWSREHKDADVGLALSLNSQRGNYRWQPVARDDQVRSLVDQKGLLWPVVMQTTVNAVVEEAEVELRAQILRAQLEGLQPTHLTTQMGALYTRLDLTHLYLGLAQEYWIPALVVELTPEHIERFRRLGVPLPDELAAAIQDYPLPKLDDLQFVPSGETYEEKKQGLLALVDGLSSGLTSVEFYPAVESPALRQIVDDAEQRLWDAQLLEDPDVKARLAADDVVLTTWREIMQRFEGTAEAKKPADAADAAH
jgi:chitin disaccharide deacetylase